MRALRPLLVVVGLLVAGCSGGSESASVTTTSSSTTTTTSTTTTSIPTTIPPETDPSPVPTNPAVVGFLGDSLLHQAVDLVQAEFPGRSLVIESAPGLEAFDARYMVGNLREKGVGTLGVVLGTNNASDGFQERDRRLLEGIARAASFAGCVRWVTVTETTPNPAFNAAARQINDALAEVAAEREAVELVDWAAAIAANPDWLASDGIHHTPAGQEALAELLADALADCPG